MRVHLGPGVSIGSPIDGLTWEADRVLRLAHFDLDRDDDECLVCGNRIVQANAEGVYYDAGPFPCLTCGTWSWVSVDAETFDGIGTEEHVLSIDQPACDGAACGNEAPDGEYEGEGCEWQCKRAQPFASKLTVGQLLGAMGSEPVLLDGGLMGNQETGAYVGRCRKCNAARAIAVDDPGRPKDSARWLKEMAMDGMVIERATIAEAREALSSHAAGCPNKPEVS